MGSEGENDGGGASTLRFAGAFIKLQFLARIRIRAEVKKGAKSDVIDPFQDDEKLSPRTGTPAECLKDFSHFHSQNVELKHQIEEANQSCSPKFKLEVTFYTSYMSLHSYELHYRRFLTVRIFANPLLAGKCGLWSYTAASKRIYANISI